MSDAVDDQNEHEPQDHDPVVQPGDTPPTAADPATADSDELTGIDVVGIEADLDGVQAALTRLADGTYWTDEVTGQPIPADVLAADPLARRA